jgi:hypothetical protein
LSIESSPGGEEGGGSDEQTMPELWNEVFNQKPYEKKSTVQLL